MSLRSRETSAEAWYNSLQMGLQRRFQSGYQYQLSYTWGKTQNTGSQINNDFGETADTAYTYDTKMRKGLAPWHVEQSFRASWVAELPFGQGKAFGSSLSGIAQHLLGGWQMGGIFTLSDGSPQTITMDDPDGLQDLGIGEYFPDLIPGGDNNPVQEGPGPCG